MKYKFEICQGLILYIYIYIYIYICTYANLNIFELSESMTLNLDEMWWNLLCKTFNE